MKAGDLDRRVTLRRPAPAVDDGFTRRPGGWINAATMIAAQRLPLSDSERVRAAQAGAAVTDRFRIRWSAKWRDVGATWQLDCEGRRYQVAAVKEIGRKRGLELTCTALADAPVTA